MASRGGAGQFSGRGPPAPGLRTLLAQGPEAYEPDRGNGRKTGRLIPNLATSYDLVVRDEMRGDNAPSVTDRFEDILGLWLESGPVDG